jgi:hypothetical protein
VNGPITTNSAVKLPSGGGAIFAWCRLSVFWFVLSWRGPATVSAVVPPPGYQLATFSADVTVPLGHGMMGGAWLSRSVADPLEAHGLVLLGADLPIVFVAVDWCEIRNDAYDQWRKVLGEAAGTNPERVMVCTVHQHDAPVADLQAERLLRAGQAAGTVCDVAFHAEAVQRVARALREALPGARPLTHLGLGEAQVKEVASNRRYLSPDGSVRFDRMSRTTNPAAVAAPEGLIDPWLKTLSFWDGDRPLAAVSGYATHPMSHYGAGDVSADFPGQARRRRQQDTPEVKQIYFTGCGGNVTAGKYNNGAPENRAVLAGRLYEALVAAWGQTKRFPLTQIQYRLEQLWLEPRDEVGFTRADLETKLKTETRPFQQCLAAMGLSWRQRLAAGQPIDLPVIDFGCAQWLLLPGESYVEYQLAAQRMRPDCFVVVAGYGEGATGYIPTDRHFAEKDGNLSDWCWVAPGSERRMLEGIRRALAVADLQAPPWQTNLPIVYVKKELYLEHPKPGAAALVSVYATGPKLERMEIQALEIRDDVPGEPKMRHSTDNGQSWSEFDPLPPTLSYPRGVEVWEGGGAKFFDPTSGVLIELWLRQIALKGLYHNFTYYRLSRDHGHTWSKAKQLRYETGAEFDPQNPLNPAFLQRNHGYFGNNLIRLSNGTVLTAVAHANAPADPGNQSRPWRMGSLCFIGRWDAVACDYEWAPGQRVEISPGLSARGLMEPEVAELRDGRVLVIWRGSDTPTTPGRKWYALSSDGGRTLSELGELRYDDGTRFYSPSSIHRLIRHSISGKLYWLGNLCAAPPRGNAPRYPLVIAEVDETIPALKRATVTAIDDRQPGVPEGLQLSNFSLLENREIHDLELWLTRYGEDPSNVFTADNYKYTIQLRPPHTAPY